MKQEFRFYTLIILGYILILIGLFSPPLGEIHTSIIYGSGMFIVLAGTTIGLDIPAIIREIRLLRESNKSV